MSIADIQTRISQFQRDPLSITQASQSPSKMFDAILQEKLGAFQMPESTSDTVTPAAASLLDQESVTAKEIFLENTINGSTPVLSNNFATQAYNSSMNIAETMAQGAASIGGMPTNTGLTERDLTKAAPYMQYVNEASQRYGMPVNLILGIMKSESDFNNECVSYAGAKGLMQLMPETAAEVGVTDEFDPRQNILGSVEYVTKLINKYNGDVRLALAAYNTGPGKIARRGVTSSTSPEYLTVPQSIRDYADRVLRYAGYQN